MPQPAATARSVQVPAAVGLGVITGALIALQGRANGSLGAAGLGAIMASVVSFIVTVASILAIIAVSGRWDKSWRIVRRKGKWWWFAIGLCGMPIVIAMAQGVPVIGVAMASVCSVAGQTVSGLMLDAKGVGVPSPIRMTARRIIAGLCGVAGLAVVVFTAPVPASSTPLAVGLMAVFLFLSGFILSGQQAGNGHVAGIAGDPLIPTMTAAMGGTVGIVLIAAVAHFGGWLPPIEWPSFSHDGWLYLGGVLGALITAASAWAVRFIGTFTLTLVVVGGQMVMALVLDAVTDVGVSWATVVSIVVVSACVVLALSPRHTGAPSKQNAG